ncbi:MAG: segregation/condensation protein A [Cloacibacillus sp.]
MPDEIIAENAAGQNAPGFEVRLGSFSGPLDLLCHLVESRELDAVKLNITELVSQYISFLVTAKGATLNELAEFFTFASRLLLRKVHSLLPGAEPEELEELPADDYIESPEELAAIIARYKPYRAAARRLAAAKENREKYFVRVIDEEDNYYYDIGDLETLAAKWWETLARYEERTQADRYESEEMIWDEIPDAMPEERQIEERMNELLSVVRGRRQTLGELLSDRNPKTLIVTLLALLEMSRLGLVHIIQTETLGGVEIAAY